MKHNGSYDDSENRFDDVNDDDYGLLDDLSDDDYERDSARRRAQRSTYRPRYRKPGRRPASERDGAFNALMWLLDGATGMVEELRHNDLGLPEEFWIHAGAARRESLMALRAVLDEWIDDEGEETSPPNEARPKKRGGIDIDF